MSMDQGTRRAPDHLSVTPALSMTWQTIETAPRDGSVIVATWKDTWKDSGNRLPHIHIEAMYWDEESWWYAYDGDGPARPPTHWMPLPTAPDVEASEVSDDR